MLDGALGVVVSCIEKQRAIKGAIVFRARDKSEWAAAMHKAILDIKY